MKQVIAARRKAAEYLKRAPEEHPGIVVPPLDTDQIKSAHHLYLLQVDPAQFDRDIQEFKQRLQAKGVTQIPHFAPLYRFSYLKQLGHDTDAMRRSCPNAEEAFLHRFTHLPLYPLTREQLEYLADTVIECAHEMRRARTPVLKGALLGRKLEKWESEDGLSGAERRRQRCVAGQVPRRLPVFGCSEEFDVRIAGASYERYCASAETMVAVQKTIVKRMDYDWVWLQIDDCIEFELLGVGVKGGATSSARPATTSRRRPRH